MLMFGSVSQLGFGGRVWDWGWVRVRNRVMVRFRIDSVKSGLRFGLG